MKEIYLIKVYDPNGGDHGMGSEFYDYRKGAFADKDLAEEVVQSMRCFAEKGSEVTFRVQPFKFSEEKTFDEWMDNNAPWRQKKPSSSSETREGV